MNIYDIELPAEFRSGNDIPVTQATIKRERMQEILRATIEADRKRRGEPVLVGWAVGAASGGLLHASKYTEYEARRAGYSLPLYRLTTPQPAEPVKEPSDEEARRLYRAIYKVMERLGEMLNQEQYSVIDRLLTDEGVEPPSTPEPPSSD